ncbi:MAG: HD domain-containing protein [Archaeoglobaceae archaeon]|nr:HD domain-containing protein [Archaeoglobaceae archaeon]MDW7990311.1 HD domain-containing protein [Archaeoglobaceae archaeon]
MVHDEDHVARVIRIAKFLAEKEGANIEIVLKSAELHDVARNFENHAFASAMVAEKILREQGFDEKFIFAVKDSIETHSFSTKIEPKTLEARILSDADKLDAMGAVGVARAFMFSGEKGRSIEDTLRHFEEKLLKLKNNLYTDTAKRIGKNRHRFLELFYEEIKRELAFEDFDQ